MTLQFAREVLILDGLPVIGTVEVEMHAEIDPYDGLWQLDPEVIGFEPEDGRKGLLWAGVEGPAEAWLAQNRSRVEKRALGH